MPERVKVRGDLWHAQVPEGAVYVGRAAPGLPGSKFANQFRIGEKISRDSALWPHLAQTVPGGTSGLSAIAPLTAEVATAAYGWWLYNQPHLFLAVEPELAGRDLACWCKLPKPGEDDHCHAAFLLALAADLAATPQTEGEQ